MPREVFFFFMSLEIRHYGQRVFVLKSRRADVTDFVSPVTAIDEFKTVPRDGYDPRYDLATCNARRRFYRVFGIADYQLLRQPGVNAMRVAPTKLLHE